MYKKYANFLLEKALDDIKNRDTYFEIIKVLLSQNNTNISYSPRIQWDAITTQTPSRPYDVNLCSTQNIGVDVYKSENGTNPIMRRSETYAEQ